MKKVALIPAITVLLFATTALAQAYYPSYGPGSLYPASTYASNCVSLSGNLSFGSRNGEVRVLQQFLVAQNYPGGGAWMVTGYYGNATVQAVRNLQQSVGLPMTGSVDAATRSAIQMRSCGLTGNTYTNYLDQNYVNYGTYPYGNTYPTYTNQNPNPTYVNPNYYPYPAPTYPTNNPWGSSPVISSLSPTSGGQGTVVTVYGSNFDYQGTSVRFGSNSIVPAINPTQNQFTFSVPNVPSSSYPITVTTSRGISNTLSFNVTGSTNCSWGSWNQCTPINLTSLSPNSGQVGTAITIYGNGFSTSGNTIYFGNVTLPNISSNSNGTSITFTIPYTVSGYGQQVVNGVYPVSVRNSQGQVSNTLNLTVTSYSGGGSGAPVVGSVTGPTSLQVGTQGTWTLTVNASYGTYITASVRWGDENIYAYSASAPQSAYVSAQQTITFTHAYPSVGTYTPVFTITGSGGSNTASATVQVTGGSNNNYLSLSSINPNVARVGTYVTLYGNGFTSTGNDVHFGAGGTRNLSSNGSTISFVVPSWISACDFLQQGYSCGSSVTQVTPATYQVYVTNSMGTTNVVNFTVTQ